jgi:hypothetical protein
MRSTALLSLLIALSATKLSGQVCPVSLIANVLGANGFPITTLETSDFEASQHGRPLPLLASGFRSDPSVRVTVLLDVSASMAVDGGKESVKWHIARDAVADLLSAAPKETQVSLLTFSTQIVRRFKSADGHRPIEDWLSSGNVRHAADVKGMTALYSTIHNTLEEMKPAQAGDAIFVITDGGDTEGTESVSQVIRELQLAGIRLFAFLLNDSLGTHPSARDLYDIAKASGGLTFVVNPFSAGTGWAGSGFHRQYDYNQDKGKIVQADSRWAMAAITNFYVLTVNGADIAARSGNWELELTGRFANKKKETTLTYPMAIDACVAEPAGK